MVVTIRLMREEDVDTIREVDAVAFWMWEKQIRALFDLYARLGLDQHLSWRLYIGLLSGEPVAASRLFLAAGVAGIYHVATIPEARRQGIGMAMTLAPLREARAMGYQIGVLRAVQVGLGVYRQLGFQEYCNFGVYVKYGLR